MSGAEISPLPVITATALLADLSAPVLSKARGAVRLRLVHPDPAATGERQINVWWIESLRKGVENRYRVSTDFDPATGGLSWITCTCLHGQRAGFGLCHCYHAGAVLLALTEHL